jgi:glycosyltransferase involved in cell wall biosynthesis
LISRIEREEEHHSVIVLGEIGGIGQSLLNRGFKVDALGIHSVWSGLFKFFSLVITLRKQRPNIVQTWMYHADLFGGLGALFAGCRSIVWGVHSTGLPGGRHSKTSYIRRICALLSKYLPSKIICCADSVKVAHYEIGYSLEKMIVISNGYDLTAFRNNRDLRSQMRAQLGLEEKDLIIGIVGRFDPLKDYKNFIAATSSLASLYPLVKFLCIGKNITIENEVLKFWLDKSLYPERYILLGERDDISACMSAMDIFCLSSVKEGFPNVVCEAMSMQIPCVVTDVGDVARIVGNTGIIVSPSNSTDLEGGLVKMISLSKSERSGLGELARMRIQENFSIDSMASGYQDLYHFLLNR